MEEQGMPRQIVARLAGVKQTRVEETLAGSTEEVLATFRLYRCKSISAISNVLMGTSK
jgi:hypothetical protein